ncbi:MAG: hypothetical protein PHI37_05410 [Candidatus Gracilibacteria bacterium]|nr:hypothetical protein [Candidatus Gracilibacteria bacterium]
MGFLYMIIYLLFLILLYAFIVERLKILSQRHMENTGIESLSRGYRIVKRRMIFLLIVLYFLGSLILLTFSKDDLLYKTGLYNDQETLDNDVF